MLAAAQRIQADYLVTSDKRLARSAPVACLDVPDMLALLQAAKVDGDGGDTLPTGSKYFLETVDFSPRIRHQCGFHLR